MRAIGVALEYDSTASFTVEAGTPIHFARTASIKRYRLLPITTSRAARGIG
jgi:hypothetical protein